MIYEIVGGRGGESKYVILLEVIVCDNFSQFY